MSSTETYANTHGAAVPAKEKPPRSEARITITRPDTYLKKFLFVGPPNNPKNVTQTRVKEAAA